MLDAIVLTVPGLGGSGPQHWQSLWESRDPRIKRVNQRDWDRPDRAEWIAALDRAVGANAGQTVVAAHSLSCALVAHWVAESGKRLRGALLVSPSDVDSDIHTPPETWVFRPMPASRLPFPSIVIASRDDPYVDFQRARALADSWGSRFADAGAVGHINSASNLGDWPFGKTLLDELITA